MKNSNNFWDKVKKIGKLASLPMLGVLITTIATEFNIPLGSQGDSESEQPASTVSNTGMEGDIIITNNIPLPPPIAQQTPQAIPTTQKEKIAQTNITQQTEGNDNCSVINNGENSSADNNCSKTEIEKIEKQTNDTRNTEAEQYIEKTGNDNTNCVGNDNGSACGNGTININPS